MGTSPSARMYTALMYSCPVLPAPLLRAAYASAQQHNDNDLTQILVSRPDAPADLVEQFAQLTDLDLASRYRSRRLNPTASKACPPEQRASLLAQSLRGTDPTASAVRDALARFDTKPSRVLANALAGRDPRWFTPEQAASILTHVSPLPERWAYLGRPWLAGRLGPDLATQLLANTHSLQLVRSLAAYDLPTGVLASAVRTALLFVDMTTGNRTTPSETVLDETLAVLFLSRDATERDALRAAVLDAPWPALDQSTPRTRTWIQNKVTTWANRVPHAGNQQARLAWSLEPAAPPQEITNLSQATLGHLTALAASGNADSLHELTEHLHTGDPWAAVHAIEIALRNPQLQTADRHVLLDDLVATFPGEAGAGGDGNALRSVDAVATFGHDPATVTAWLTLKPAQVLNEHGWAPFGGPSNAPQCIRTWQQDRATGRRTSGQVSDLLEAASRGGMTRPTLLALDRASLSVLWTLPRGDASDVLPDQIAALLADTLGSDPQAWAMYELLAATFPGTLGELLTTCQAVVS